MIKCKIIEVIVNWYVDSGKSEIFDKYSIHSNFVEKIEYHVPAGIGDQHYVDVHSKNGKIKRLFNINSIIGAKEEF